MGPGNTRGPVSCLSGEKWPSYFTCLGLAWPSHKLRSTHCHIHILGKKKVENNKAISQ